MIVGPNMTVKVEVTVKTRYMDREHLTPDYIRELCEVIRENVWDADMENYFSKLHVILLNEEGNFLAEYQYEQDI